MKRILAAAALALALGAPGAANAAHCSPEFSGPPGDDFTNEMAALNHECLHFDAMCKAHNRKACIARDLLAARIDQEHE